MDQLKSGAKSRKSEKSAAESARGAVHTRLFHLADKWPCGGGMSRAPESFTNCEARAGRPPLFIRTLSTRTIRRPITLAFSTSSGHPGNREVAVDCTRSAGERRARPPRLRLAARVENNKCAYKCDRDIDVNPHRDVCTFLDGRKKYLNGLRNRPPPPARPAFRSRRDELIDARRPRAQKQKSPGAPNPGPPAPPRPADPWPRLRNRSSATSELLLPLARPAGVS
ncbi:hypothetical protein EVAR_39485_1 [Eumeta japonica]|uniref:Uncharacterized protein n=1 Tax=Eumeta variegata TaxID=151549 RepID=A0A4C1VYX8_EUMVA|nr:hypothetical protein EVAR_39485_1 [Eumeta japonica]